MLASNPGHQDLRGFINFLSFLLLTLHQALIEREEGYERGERADGCVHALPQMVGLHLQNPRMFSTAKGQQTRPCSPRSFGFFGV